MTNSDSEPKDSDGRDVDTPITRPNYSQNSLGDINNVNGIISGQNHIKEQPPQYEYNSETQQQQHPLNQRRLATVLYLLTTSLLFADQNLLSPNLTAIAAEFNFSDNERDKKLGGDIAIAFFMVGVPASFLVGCLADVMNHRSLLFLWVILIGEGACMATYWVQTYQQLYWCRALTGCSVGGAMPLIYSVLGDYYEPKERGWVSGAISMGCGVGISVGQGLAGFLGPRFGWRMPFLVVSTPAIVCALGVWLWIGEVERGGGEKRSLLRNGELHSGARIKQNGNVSHEADDGDFEMLGIVDEKEPTCHDDIKPSCKRRVPPWNTIKTEESSQACYVPLSNATTPTTNQPRISETITKFPLSNFYHQSIQLHIQTTKALFKCPSVVLAIFQGAPGCVPWGVVNTYLNDYLSTNRGMSVEGATLIILVFGVGNGAGVTFGGMGSTYLYTNFGPRFPSLFSGCAAILGCFPMWFMINYDFSGNGNNDKNEIDNGDASGSLLIFISISFLAGILSGITGPIVKSTLQNVTLPQMRGQAFALLNTFDDFGRGLGPAFVAWMIENMGGRQNAFNIGVGGWIFCGLLNGFLFWTVEKDEENVRSAVESMLIHHEEEISTGGFVEEDSVAA
ncbi:hypothetical protein ACHAXS_008226 [Conticribra weissflogii]